MDGYEKEPKGWDVRDKGGRCPSYTYRIEEKMEGEAKCQKAHLDWGKDSENLRLVGEYLGMEGQVEKDSG